MNLEIKLFTKTALIPYKRGSNRFKVKKNEGRIIVRLVINKKEKTKVKD